MYKCFKCSQPLQLRFYNPCSFVLHVHKHIVDNENHVNLDNVTFETLPVGLAGFLPHPSIPLLYENKEDCLVVEANTTPIFCVPLEKCIGSNIVYFSATTLVFETEINSSKFLELKQVSGNIPHCKFITKKEPLNNLRKDFRILNKSFNRIPEQRSGIKMGISRLERVNFAKLKNDLNLAQMKKCTECNCVVQNLVPHFEGYDKPSNRCYTCVICNFVVTSECSLSAHQRIHLEKAPYVCPDCGTELADFKELLSHTYKICLHLPKQVRYKCQSNNCTRSFIASAKYEAHFSTHINYHYTCPICSIKLTSEENVKTHEEVHGINLTGLLKKVSTCFICNEYIENSLKHADLHISNEKYYIYVYRCRYCRCNFKSPKTYSSHVKLCSKKLISNPVWHQFNLLVPQQCMYCKTIYKLAYSNNLLISCPDCINETQRVCILCKKVLSSGKLKEHLLQNKCPYVNPVVKLQKISYAMLETYTKDNQDNDSDNDELRIIKRKKCIIPPSKSEKNDYSNRIAEDNHIKEPIAFNETYSCSLCDSFHETRNKFHEHILTHRNISTAYQCMECGECFVVKPSLAKHLLHCHQINDIDLYLKENSCCDEKAIKELTDHIILGATKKQLKENQCSVCYKQFSQQFDLKKHFRVHGMAFLFYNAK